MKPTSLYTESGYHIQLVPPFGEEPPYTTVLLAIDKRGHHCLMSLNVEELADLNDQAQSVKQPLELPHHTNVLRRTRHSPNTGVQQSYLSIDVIGETPSICAGVSIDGGALQHTVELTPTELEIFAEHLATTLRAIDGALEETWKKK